MAGTVTTTRHGDNRQHGISTVTVSWTADSADGSVPATTLPKLNGLLRALVTNPGAVAPTDNYDISLVDGQGADRLAGAGADRDTANSETKVFDPPIPVSETDSLAFTLANNVVNSAVGVAVLYVETFPI